MTREAFIKKWLGNNNFQYCEEHKELIREDLDSVIDYHHKQVKSVHLADVGKRFWLTDKMEVVLLCERCDAPTTKVMIEHQKVVSEKEVECDCGEDIYDDDGY